MCSLNNQNVITRNYFGDACGADKGIGGARYIDTTNAAPTPIDGVRYINTENGKPDPVINGVTRVAPNYHYARTDDPLGADADNLAKAVTAAELKDGTVFDLLNGGGGTSGNWEQGKKVPVFRDYEANIWEAGASSAYVGLGEYGEAVLAAAVYAGYRLDSIQLIPVTVSGEVALSLTVPQGGYVKLFLWEEIGNLKPLCEEKLVSQ
jgi:hypothetical protein